MKGQLIGKIENPLINRSNERNKFEELIRKTVEKGKEPMGMGLKHSLDQDINGRPCGPYLRRSEYKAIKESSTLYYEQI